MLVLFSCASSITQKDDFTFNLIEPIVNVRCGETVDYTACLINNSKNEYTLSHGVPLITLYVYNDGDAPEEGVGSSLIKTIIKADEYIDKSIHVKFDEPGKYRLRAFCSFCIEDIKYFYEVEPILINVSDYND